MRIKCLCGNVPCWWYAPADEWDIRSRPLCAECVSRTGDYSSGFPDDPPTDWYGNIVPATFHLWPAPIPKEDRDPNAYYIDYEHDTPGYWLWIDPFDKKGRTLPDCEYWWIGYHKRKWQWFKKERLDK